MLALCNLETEREEQKMPYQLDEAPWCYTWIGGMNGLPVGWGTEYLTVLIIISWSGSDNHCCKHTKNGKVIILKKAIICYVGLYWFFPVSERSFFCLPFEWRKYIVHCTLQGWYLNVCGHPDIWICPARVRSKYAFLLHLDMPSQKNLALLTKKSLDFWSNLPSEMSSNDVDNLDTVLIIQKLPVWSRNRPDNLETVCNILEPYRNWGYFCFLLNSLSVVYNMPHALSSYNVCLTHMLYTWFCTCTYMIYYIISLSQ